MIALRQIEDRNCPVILCDLCGREICDAGMGIAKFSDEGIVEFFHKGECDVKSGGSGGWFPIDVFLVYLAHNVKADLDKVRKNAEMLALFSV